MMNRIVVGITVLVCLLLAGCENLRFSPSQSQKQNAWLHNRTTALIAQTAKEENSPEKLQYLSQLSQLQSRAFLSYFGLPKEYPLAETAEDVLCEANYKLARTALDQSADRPDNWQLADSAMELAIGLSALLGGVYGTRAIGVLKTARIKSRALKEIVQGNELFKKANSELATTFKQAHQNQSPQTRQIVAEIKT